MSRPLPFAGGNIPRALPLVAGFLAIVFLIGGGSASDIDSLLFLRPFAALALVGGAWLVRGKDLLAFRWPILLFGLTVLLTILHLIPLPPGLWAALPGRDLMARVGADAGLSAPWRPVALVPTGAWNALFSLLVPAAVMVLMIGSSDTERRRALDVILLFAVATSAVALLQIVIQDRSLYFFEITNFGNAVGLFANRNHQAVFLACLLPALALFAAAPGRSSETRMRHIWIGAGAALFVFPLILITGSRAGIVLALPAMLLSVLLFEVSLPRTPEVRARRKRRLMIYAAIIVAIVALVMVFVLFSRAEAFSRLYNSISEGESNNRLPFWRLLPAMIWQYFPFGSGIGSFPEVFQIHEPVGLLKRNYFNHAHNDLLEVALVAGLPGILLVILSLCVYGVAVLRLIRPVDAETGAVAYGRLGGVIVLLMGLASLADYPLRTPSLTALFMVAVLWMAQGAQSRKVTNGRRKVK